jgi:hypothetical protein
MNYTLPPGTELFSDHIMERPAVGGGAGGGPSHGARAVWLLSHPGVCWRPRDL